MRVSPRILGYSEVVEITYRKRKLKRFSRLFCISKQVEAEPGYFVKLEIVVPQPTLENPKPVAVLFMQNSTGKLWQKFDNVEKLRSLLWLNEQDFLGLEQAFREASLIAERYREIKMAMETALGKPGNTICSSENQIIRESEKKSLTS